MLSIHHVNCSSALLKLNVFLSDVGCGGSSLSACVCVRGRGEERRQLVLIASHMLPCPQTKHPACSPLDGTAWVGLAQVPHPRPLAVELLGRTKSSPWLPCQKPTERISFRFASKPAAAVFPGQEEQKPGVSPVPQQLWGDVGSHKLGHAVPWSHSKERMEMTSRTFKLIFLGFLLASSHVAGMSTAGVAGLSARGNWC